LAEAGGGALNAEDRNEISAAAEDGSGDGVQVVLALADGLREALDADALELGGETAPVGDGIRREAL